LQFNNSLFLDFATLSLFIKLSKNKFFEFMLFSL